MASKSLLLPLLFLALFLLESLLLVGGNYWKMSQKEGDLGTVTLPVKDFLALQETKEERLKKECPPEKGLINLLEIDGHRDEDESPSPERSTFSLTLQVTILSSLWNVLPLFDSSVAVESLSVKCTSPKPKSNPNSNSKEEKESNWDGHLAVVNSSVSLITHHSGEYSLFLKLGAKNSGGRGSKTCSLSVPKATKTVLTYRLQETNCALSCSPATTSSIQTETSNDNQKKSTMVLDCVLPPTSHLTLQWARKTAFEDESKKKEEEKEMVVTADQNTVYSIGEGVCQVKSGLVFELVNGAASIFDIVLLENQQSKIEKPATILSVTGAYLKKWEALEKSENENDNEEEEERRTIRVWMDHAQEGNVNLEVRIDMEMRGTTCLDTHLPLLRAVSAGGKPVTREKGMFAVEARTNVEIVESASRHLTRVDVSELPPALKRRASNPVLLAYKYVMGGGQFLVLSVTRHRDIGVLIASIDEAKYTLTHAAEAGTLLHSLVLSVRNTSKQYLRITLPEYCTVWSTFVDGESVKPAQDEDEKLLVPLKKGASDEAFKVRILFLERPEPLQIMSEEYSRGKLNFSLASVDLPINHLYLTVYLPLDFSYAEFTGDLKEAQCPVGAQQPMRVTSWSDDESDLASGYGGKKSYGGSKKRRSNISNKYQSQSSSSSTLLMDESTELGVCPVRIAMLKSGKPFYFERLLIKNDTLKLQVEYKKKKKPVKRRIDPNYEAFFKWAVLLVGICTVVYTRFVRK